MIGIAAVTTIVSIGQGATKLVSGEFETLGTNVVLVLPGQSRRGGDRQSGAPTLTAGDADEIGEVCPAVLACSPIVRTAGQIIYRNENWKTQKMQGVGAGYLVVRNWELEAGGFFSRNDIETNAKVCVISQTLIPKLFRTINPIDETIGVNNLPFRVIGIRMAIGARGKDILRQFPIESVVLSCIGGAILQNHNVVFFEERFQSIGPIGRLGQPACYPRSQPPSSTAGRRRN